MNEALKDTDSEYTLAGLAHDVVERYNPQYLTKGSESLVYIPKREGREYAPSVFKVNIRSIKLCTSWLASNTKASVDDCMQHFQMPYDELIKTMNTARDTAVKYFGERQVVSEKIT